MSEFRFAEPTFVHALWAVLAFVGVLFWLDRRGGDALDRFVGKPLQDRLVTRPSSERRSLRVLLLGLASVCAVLALMRPQWGMRVVSTSRVGAEIMVALDVSRSMLAEDVAPNRLERAKAELVDLLAYLDGDQVGLIAFAGRATVLSPLTPDFGFLRLVLEGVGPGSVTRGGTRLAEPIRKALAGFGPSEGASRAILLITDGEDHDSFPIDVAREASEAGVKIIAIGFGDEAGSEIRVTDPRTGARRVLRNSDGDPVLSRLDGELLRELALTTGGAYVPAGTGVLDLESIYDQHIARLTRGELDGTRTVRDEGYPWFVMLALILLVSSVAVSGGRLLGGGHTLAAVWLALLVTAAAAKESTAEDDSTSPTSTPVAAASEPDIPGDPAAGEHSREVLDPRSVYNRGVTATADRELEEAERNFSRARRDAKADDQLRFHTTFNLGWVSAEQAARLRGESPRDALTGLYRAADWFRQAVSLRPEDEDARYNLEVVLRRTLVLADEIARNETGGVEGALGELAGRQREATSNVASLLERSAAEIAATDFDDGGNEGLRGAYRARASAQRGILSDADQLAVVVGRELEAIEATSEEERSPEDAMRSVQLGGVLEYLHRARERMGQARRQLRERRAARAYRRTSAALAELKRAQDQLRTPVAVLDQLLSDGSDVARSTALLALSERNVPGLEDALPTPPAWLSTEALADEQTAHAERTDELELRLAAGLAHAANGDAGAQSPEQQEFLAAVAEAEPFLRAASEHSQHAAELLQGGQLSEAPGPQRRALAALADARERFLDLRGLIEVTLEAERRITQILAVEPSGPQLEDPRVEYLPSLLAAQQANLMRGERLEAKLAAEITRTSEQVLAAENAAQPPADRPSQDAEALEQRRRQLDLATQLLTVALAGMDAVAKELDSQPHASASWELLQRDAAQIVERLAELRRLFFSIVEHVRELARRQIDLSDETQDALASDVNPDAPSAARAAKIAPDQQRLADEALTVANALAEQSNAAGGVVSAEPEAAETAQRLRGAGEHVLLAQGEMLEATGFVQAASDLKSARAAQDAASLQLAQALALLEPPERPSPQDDQQQQQEQQQQQADQQNAAEQQAGKEEHAEAQPQRVVDPAQLLQEVRDREAQRRRERGRRQAAYETVEKDW